MQGIMKTLSDLSSSVSSPEELHDVQELLMSTIDEHISSAVSNVVANVLEVLVNRLKGAIGGNPREEVERVQLHSLQLRLDACQLKSQALRAALEAQHEAGSAGVASKSTALQLEIEAIESDAECARAHIQTIELKDDGYMKYR